MMTPAELFTLCREMKGYTLREVEKHTGISNAFISQLETGKADNLSFRNALILCDLYGIKLERLAKLMRKP